MVKRSKQTYSTSHSKWVLLLLIQLIQTIHTCIDVGEHKCRAYTKTPKDLLVYFQPLENTWQLRTKYEHFEPQIAGKNKNIEFEQNFTDY